MKELSQEPHSSGMPPPLVSSNPSSHRPAERKWRTSSNQITLYVTTSLLGLSFPMVLHVVLTQSCASISKPVPLCG